MTTGITKEYQQETYGSPEQSSGQDEKDFRENPRKIACQGVMIVCLFFGILGLGAAFGKISGAVVAPGTVKVDTYTKTIQHLEGGIVDDILVREGDKVSAGQVLITLKNVHTDASVDMLHKTLISRLAAQARLIAEKDFAEIVTWPADIIELATIYDAGELLENELKIFNSRMEAFASQKALLESQIVQMEAQISGLEEQATAESEIIFSYTEEVQAKSALYKERYIDKSQLLELQRQLSMHKGTLGRTKQSISEVQQKIIELELRIVDMRTQLVTEANQELGKVENDIVQIREQIRPIMDAKARLHIISPVEGHVVNLQVHSKAGVIQPGETLMGIVPVNVPMMVETRVPVDKIADVHLNQDAQVQMDAFDIRTTPLLPAKVMYISADRFEEQTPAGMMPYYLSHVEVLPETLHEAEVYMSPGMPVTVYITTGQRSILNYMLEPLLKNWEKALRD